MDTVCQRADRLQRSQAWRWAVAATIAPLQRKSEGQRLL